HSETSNPWQDVIGGSVPLWAPAEGELVLNRPICERDRGAVVRRVVLSVRRSVIHLGQRCMAPWCRPLLTDTTAEERAAMLTHRAQRTPDAPGGYTIDRSVLTSCQ
ncbi:hypothetical protein KUCAC02_015270, partial [Chaenocephalus aceratus]